MRTEAFGARSLPVSQSHFNLVNCYDISTRESRAQRRHHFWESFSIRRDLLPMRHPLLSNIRSVCLTGLVAQWNSTRDQPKSAMEFMSLSSFIASFGSRAMPPAEELDRYFDEVRARGGDVESDNEEHEA